MTAVITPPAAEPAAIAPVVRPPRITFAGVCIYCEQRDCVSQHCEQVHQRTRWDTCPDCDGIGVAPHGACHCAYGLAEVAR